MTWKNTIKKNEFSELQDLSDKLVRHAINELKVKDRDLESVFRIALNNLEISRGEQEEERRVDSVAGSRFER
tara:strand:+ start:1854 stop:2069 length:216 start_codon:yes stop_codon:yes gene_type:complete